MYHTDGMVHCDGCGVEFTWSPYVVITPVQTPGARRRSEYCCQACAEGRPCDCAERMELDWGDERRSQSAAIIC